VTRSPPFAAKLATHTQRRSFPDGFAPVPSLPLRHSQAATITSATAASARPTRAIRGRDAGDPAPVGTGRSPATAAEATVAAVSEAGTGVRAGSPLACGVGRGRIGERRGQGRTRLETLGRDFREHPCQRRIQRRGRGRAQVADRAWRQVQVLMRAASRADPERGLAREHLVERAAEAVEITAPVHVLAPAICSGLM
jgi:hypothetical protein